MKIKLVRGFVLDAIDDKIDDAVRFGVNRAYKHTTADPPDDLQIDTIRESVKSALFDIFDFGAEEVEE